MLGRGLRLAQRMMSNSNSSGVRTVRLSELETPALCVDLDALEQNESTFASLMAKTGLRARPHVKSHKTPFFAKRQLAQSGTVLGLSCATVGEVECMVRHADARDVLLTNEVVVPSKIDRLLQLCSEYEHFKLSVCVDNASVLKDLSRRATDRGVSVGIVVELNVGQNRCGVDTKEEAVELAKLANSLEGLRFVGVQGYQGACQHLRTREERANVSRGVAKSLAELSSMLESESLKCEIITGGGTGTFEIDAASGVFTEVQPGSYLFMDCDYGANEEGFSKFCPALFILATVIHSSSQRFVLDAGIKSHSIESGLPRLHASLQDHDQFTMRNGGDEHMVLDVVPGRQPTMPCVGDKVKLIVGHVDPTFNMHDVVHVFRGDQVLYQPRIFRNTF